MSTTFGTEYTNDAPVNSLGGIHGIDELSSRLSKKLFPKTIAEVLKWAEFLWNHAGIYSETIRQAVRYFLTEVEVVGNQDLTTDEQATYEDVLKNNFNILCELGTIGDDFISSGNSFTSIYTPFDRDLVCPKCGMRRALGRMYPGRVVWKGSAFSGKCPGTRINNTKCTFSGEFEVEDRRRAVADLKPVIVRWPPQFMEVDFNPISRRSVYRFDISKWTDFAKRVDQGDLLFLEDTPWEFIQALKHKKKIRFDEDVIYHMKSAVSALAIPGASGWGLPRFMSQFENVVAVALLDRFNEVILSEYLMPFRVLSPPPATRGREGQGSMDILNNMGGAKFVDNIQGMIKKHEQNPARWNIAPVALNYQVLGGEASNLAPVELLQHHELRLLRGLGIPYELQQGTRGDSMQPIIKFTMFERSWHEFVSNLNRWLRWLSARQGEIMSWADAEARLLTVADTSDEMKTQTVMQLMASGEVSKATTFRRLGLDSDYETRMVGRERQKAQKAAEDEARESEERGVAEEAVRSEMPGQNMLLAQMMGGEAPPEGAMAPGGGGAPGAAPGGMPGAAQGLSPLPPNPSLAQLESHADQIAQQLYAQHPTMRNSQLTDLGHTNPTLHALVKSRLEDMDTDAERQGRMMARSGQM